MTVALPADLPLIEGWNVWDVLQASAPVDPMPGTANQQLAAFVREAVGVPDLPIALTSSAAAGELVTSRASVPELAGTPSLGVGGSAITRRTIAFEWPSGGEPSIEWPRDDNMIVDAVYEAAPAPSVPRNAGGGTVATAGARQPEQASMLPLGLALALGLGLVLSRKRGKR